jgi:small subunit ribosomal protein S3Ae
MVVKRKTVEAWKKKEWYTIISPKLFEERSVGTTPADDPQKLADRVIEVPLREITGNMQHQFVKLLFRISEVKGNNCYTTFDGFELVREYLRRNIRRRRSMITAIREIRTKDNKTLQVTAYVFTARKVDTSKKDIIRTIIVDTLKKGESESFDSYIQKLLFGSIAADTFKKAKIVAPIKRVEIGKCEILRGKA